MSVSIEAPIAPFLAGFVLLGEACPVCNQIHTEQGPLVACFKKWVWKKMHTALEYRLDVQNLWGRVLICNTPLENAQGDVLAAASAWLNQASFDCLDCKHQLVTEPGDDLFGESAVCPACGGNRWTITDRFGNLLT